MEAAPRLRAAQPEEGELVERARQGDHDAYELLMRQHEQAAFRAALLIGGSAVDAEDVAQEAFVKAFRAPGLAVGGRDNGAPGDREHYHPTYYGAYVLDSDGNNVEAVCHTPD